MWVTVQKHGITSEGGSAPGSFDSSARYPCAGKDLHHSAQLESLGVFQTFGMNVSVPPFSLPPGGEFSGLYTFSQPHKAIIGTDSHWSVSPSQWDARMLGTKSTSLSSFSPLTKRQGYEPSSRPTEPDGLPIATQADEILCGCWDRWLVWSTLSAVIHIHQPLRSSAGYWESPTPLPCC